MKQQTKGQGSIVYLPDRDKYRAFFVTPAGKRISKSKGTKKEAADWLAQQAAAVSTNTFTEPSSLTFGAWLLTWLKEYKYPSLRPRTRETYASHISHAEPLAGVRLQSLTAPQVQSLYNQMLDKGYSANTISKIHKVLKAACHKALQLGLLPKNIFEVVVPPSVAPRPDIITFTREEIDALLEAAKEYSDGRYYPLILLAITSGMRRGEILALRFCDINLKKCEVSITRNLQKTKQGLIITPPKTKAGVRKISLPAEVVNALWALHSDRKILSLDDFIFITRNGTPYEPRNIERAWKKIASRSGIPYRNFHVLRHTHCTDLLAAGVPIVEVARRVGHARISHTLELYGHAIPRLDKEIAGKVENLYLVK